MARKNEREQSSGRSKSPGAGRASAGEGRGGARKKAKGAGSGGGGRKQAAAKPDSTRKAAGARKSGAARKPAVGRKKASGGRKSEAREMAQARAATPRAAAKTRQGRRTASRRAATQRASGMRARSAQARTALEGNFSDSTRRALWIESPGQHAERSGQTLATRNHNVIMQWAEERGAVPATISGTERDGRPGVLRFDFPDFATSGGRLRQVDWDEWFETFDQRNLVFLFQEQMKDGRQSNFFRLDSPGREEG